MAKITKRYCGGRKSPYQLTWCEQGSRHSRFFETERERDEFLRANDYLEKSSFQSLMKLDMDTISDIARIESMRGKITFREIWEFWERNHTAKRVLKLWDACDEYLRDMQANAKVIHSHFIHVRRILEVLVESFGERQVEDITRDELESWLKNLPYAPITVKNYRSCLCATWRWFEKHELVSKNVAKLIDCPNIEMGEIGILTVEETERLLRVNEKIDPEVCGLMALGLFAGMRTSAIARVAYDEITMRQGILTPAEKTKKNRRNYIENLPDNLWAWLERTPKTAFGWCERKWKKRKETALRRAGLLINGAQLKVPDENGKFPKKKIPPKNAFRHSFASYHVAWKRDFQDTALIMSHQGTDILFKHYRGIATKENAERYFNIYPSDYQNQRA